MIKGVGIDVCQISRMKLSLSKKILTKEEIVIFEQITLEERKREFLAGRFAAKEAIYKALSFIYPKLSMSEVCVLYDEFKRPYMARPILNKLRIMISISHEKEYAIAQAIVEDC